MTLKDAIPRKEYRIAEISLDGDDELEDFLFSLGCYPGESIAVVSHLKKSAVVAVKNGRYNMDRALCERIILI